MKIRAEDSKKINYKIPLQKSTRNQQYSSEMKSRAGKKSCENENL